MNKFARPIIYTLLIAGGITFYVLNAEPREPIVIATEKPVQPTQKVEKTDAEWKKILTSEQYRIARKAGTEYPNSNAYKQFKKQGKGTYYCIGCDAELFTDKQKFDSGSGWPSFYDTSNSQNVKTISDPDGIRIEVKCNVCDAHLGHLFHGEAHATPTDKRYCVNGTVLKFVPDTVDSEKPANK